MADVVGKITHIKYVDREHRHVDFQMQRVPRAQSGIGPRINGIDPGFERFSADPNSLKRFEEAVHIFRSFHDGKYVARVYEEMIVFAGDVIATGEGVLCLAEFLVGGRVGINSNSAVRIVSERSVEDFGSSRAFFRRSRFWSADSRSNEPLEINTGGAGIKG